MQECSHRSKNAHRHRISPVASSQPRPRKEIHGELKSKINSNLNNQIISKAALAKDLKHLNEN